MIKLLILISTLTQTALPLFFNDLLGAKYFPWTYGCCIQHPNLEDFKTKEFFRDHWYLLSSYGNYQFQLDGICTSAEIVMCENKITYLFYQYQTLWGKYSYLRGVTKNVQDGVSKLYVQFDFLAGLINIKIPYRVVATDYNNYAVFYSCQAAFGIKEEMAWIATRIRGNHCHDKEIKQAVQKAGLDYSDFIRQRSRGCGLNEPHLRINCINNNETK